MTAGPMGPASVVPLQPVETVGWMSGRVGPPAQGPKMTGAVAIVALLSNG